MVVLRHESDVDTWGGPDRDYYTFVIMSVLLGLVGGDHIYLRSFKTAFLKALFNLFTFGAWYWWDLSQIFFQKETVLREGLASPFDWIRNIGRGVFVSPANPVDYVSQKSYIIYGLLTVFFGLIAADKFYMGDYVMGVAKLVLCLNLFTFVIGWIWAGWDAWNAVFCEKELLDTGIPPPLGLGSFFPPTDPSVFKLQVKKEGDDAALQALGVPFSAPSGPAGQWLHWTLGILGLLPKPKPACAPRTVVPQEQTKPTAPPATTTATTEPPAANPTAPPPQTGGAHPRATDASIDGPSASGGPSGGPGPVLLGCLTAVVAAAGLKRTYEFISRQYQ